MNEYPAIGAINWREIKLERMPEEAETNCCWLVLFVELAVWFGFWINLQPINHSQTTINQSESNSAVIN